MKAKIQGTTLAIDLPEIVDSLDDEGKREFGRQLVADDYLFAAVLDCVARGEYFTDDERGAWWFSAARVLELREKLVPLMGAIAREAVREALKQRDAAKAEEERTRKWAWALYHAWPRDALERRPDVPRDWKPTEPPTDAAVDEVFAIGGVP